MVQTTISLSDELLSKIDTLSEQLDRNRSAVMQELLMRGLMTWKVSLSDIVGDLTEENIGKIVQTEVMRVLNNLVWQREEWAREAEQKSKQVLGANPSDATGREK